MFQPISRLTCAPLQCARCSRRSFLARRGPRMGALMLMKGPEVAAHYPVPSDRPFRDLDLMVEDPIAAQNALIAVGFVEYGEPAAYTGLQHLPPLIRPGAPLVVEVHRRPSQPFWLPPVSPESIFRTAVPAATGVPGILAPQPSAHAVLVVAHAWNHEPLGSMGHLSTRRRSWRLPITDAPAPSHGRGVGRECGIPPSPSWMLS